MSSRKKYDPTNDNPIRDWEDFAVSATFRKGDRVKWKPQMHALLFRGQEVAGTVTSERHGQNWQVCAILWDDGRRGTALAVNLEGIKP